MNNRQRAQYFVARNGTFIGLLILIAVFALLNHLFFSAKNAIVIALQVAEFGVVAVPLALLVISGSLDLSVGSIASMTGIVGASVMISTGSSLLGILAGLAFGVAAGALNGALVAYAKLNPIVVTLGFLAVWGGTALFITSGATLSGLPPAFNALGTAKILTIPVQMYILVLSTLLGWWLLNRHRFGRQIYAVGGNARAAFLMGVHVARVRFILHVYVGLAAALAGIMLTAKLQAAGPAVGQGLELSVLTMVLLGGVGFAGGTGRISGVIAGLLFVGVLRNGLVVVGTSQFLQQVFVGLTLILAVALDDTLRRFVHGSWKLGLTQSAVPSEGPDDAARSSSSSSFAGLPAAPEKAEENPRSTVTKTTVKRD